MIDTLIDGWVCEKEDDGTERRDFTYPTREAAQADLDADWNDWAAENGHVDRDESPFAESFVVTYAEYLERTAEAEKNPVMQFVWVVVSEYKGESQATVYGSKPDALMHLERCRAEYDEEYDDVEWTEGDERGGDVHTLNDGQRYYLSAERIKVE